MESIVIGLMLIVFFINGILAGVLYTLIKEVEEMLEIEEKCE